MNGISSQGRSATGVNVVKMKTNDDYIVAMTVTDYQEEEVESENSDNVNISEIGTIAESNVDDSSNE